MTPKRIKEINDTCYRIHKAIPLTKGMMAVIDDEDYEMVSKFKWHFTKVKGHSVGYAVRAVRENGKRIKTMPMHKMIMGHSDDVECDHIDGNGLNNRRSNLRVCTHAENLRNQETKNKFGSTGVSLHSCKRFYMARLQLNGKTIHLGNHRTIEAAKAARLAGEIKYFGEYRRSAVKNIS